MKVFAKTTGALPRVITDDGIEYPVFRQSNPNIIEQLRIVSFAKSNGAEALVIECMALQPILQSLCELKLIRSTHGVITNIREDHLDIMGPGETDVARAILGTTPVNSKLFTCELDYDDEFKSTCSDRGTDLIQVSGDDIDAVTDEEMGHFRYLEHRENVALALKVCGSLGIEREKALRGMMNCTTDPGALGDHRINFFGKTIHFVNDFAANDPESPELIWELSLRKHGDVDTRIMVINSRFDRPDRSKQFGTVLSRWPRADKYILIGAGSFFLVKYAIKSGIESRHFVSADGLETESIFEEILNHCGKSSLIVGVGNIKGPGMELATYFRNRSSL